MNWFYTSKVIVLLHRHRAYSGPRQICMSSQASSCWSAVPGEGLACGFSPAISSHSAFVSMTTPRAKPPPLTPPNTTFTKPPFLTGPERFRVYRRGKERVELESNTFLAINNNRQTLGSQALGEFGVLWAQQKERATPCQKHLLYPLCLGRDPDFLTPATAQDKWP